MMVIVLNPNVQGMLLNGIQRAISFCKDSSPVKATILVCLSLIILISAFWIGREKLQFLGDGYLVVRTMPTMESAKEIAHTNYENEPVCALAFYSFDRLLNNVGFPVSPLQVYHGGSIFFGLLSIWLIWLICCEFSENAMDRVLAFLFLIAGGGSQLFFGYVEDYAPFYFGMALFVLLSLRYLKGTTPIIAAGFSFALLFLFHFGSLIFLPCLLMLLAISFMRKNSVHLSLTAAGMAVIVVAGLNITGYSVQGFLGRFSSATGASFFHQDELTKSYSLLSGYHALDIANLLLLLSPFALPLLLFTGITFFNQRLWREPRTVFLILTSLCGLAFITGVNSLLGMSRDWDLFATFGLPLGIAAVYLWNRCMQNELQRRRLLVIMTVITGLQSFAWISVNGMAINSFKRFKVLNDERLWSTKARGSAYDDIGGWYDHQENRNEALIYYMQFYKLDQDNERININIGTEYLKLGDTAKAMSFFQHVANNGTRNKIVYSSLGKFTEKMNEPDSAIGYFQQALQIDPRDALVLNELGFVYFHDKESPDQALPYFLRAIDAEPAMWEAMLNASLCYATVGDTEHRDLYLSKAIALRPADPTLRELKNKFAGK